MLVIPHTLRADGDEPDSDKRSISGHVKDATTGEDLIGATIYIEELQSGTATNVYGFYSLHLKPGKYTLKYSYIGYEQEVIEVEHVEDRTLDVELVPKGEQLDEVEITATAPDQNVTKAEMSVVFMVW